MDYRTSSVTHDGASDPGLHMIELGVLKIGSEKIKAAGSCFDCNLLEFTFGQEYEDPQQAYRMWITNDEAQVVVRAQIAEFGRSYALDTLCVLP